MSLTFTPATVMSVNQDKHRHNNYPDPVETEDYKISWRQQAARKDVEFLLRQLFDKVLELDEQAKLQYREYMKEKFF
jgi:hypothetical protein